MRTPLLSQQIHTALIKEGPEAAAALAEEAGQLDLFERIAQVSTEEPVPNFLHSALCAMSLPVRRPKDDQKPIIRQDGQHTLVITPKSVVREVAGKPTLTSLGVPYGPLPRLVLIHIMTEAVRTKSRHVLLGRNFTDWMRRMGFQSISYGPRGSATLVKQQLDRLLACEWMIRWDSPEHQDEREFGIKEIKLTNEYVGSDRKNGSFVREIYLTEPFFEHLRNRAVPLNEHAIRQLRESATALDLYTWLAYRLPRITSRQPATLTWQQLAVHFGNDGANIRKFRQTIREAWERHVSAVYPEARAEFDTTLIRLHASPSPLKQRVVPGAHLKLITSQPSEPKSPLPSPSPWQRFIAAMEKQIGAVEARIWFADGRLESSRDSDQSGEAEAERWCLVATTEFRATWIRQHFANAIQHAAAEAGLPNAPDVIVRRR